MHDRTCPRCDRELQARQHHGEGGLMLLWQCSCGWAGARTVPPDEEPRERRTQSGTTARVHIELEDERKKA
jgi:hypothetical protein